LNAAQGVAEATLEFGPLPAAAIPTITMTPLPLPTATLQPPPPTLQPTPTPLPTFIDQLRKYWGLPLAAVIAILVSLWLVLRRVSRPRPEPEVCANCGFDLTGTTGACPQCKDTRRLPKKK